MVLRLGALLLLLCGWAQPVLAAAVAGEIHALLQAPPAQMLQRLAGEQLYYRPQLAAFYATRQDAPGWSADDEPLPAVMQLLDAVRGSRADGLVPADYHFHALNELLDRLQAEELSEDARHQQLAALELLLSDAFLMLDDCAAHGRVNPVEMSPRVMTVAELENAKRGLATVFAGSDPDTLIDALKPDAWEYRAMQGALAQYRELAAAGGLPTVPSGPVLRIGDSGMRVEALLGRLTAFGDLADREARQARDTFTTAVAVAVKRFQRRHGLSDDGTIGPATLTALNVSPSQIVDALRINMERWRWLPRELPATRLMVNVADYRATLYEDGKPALAAKVIVGQPARQTPEFHNLIQYLVINPAWDVPSNIAGEELLPQLQADPGYLARHGYQVLEGWGTAEHPVDPATVDWSKWTAETLPYHFRQPPGPENPLGRVKFMFPNAFDVYMHDTPAQELFSASQCTFSHGCIRVANAMALAATLLQLDGHAEPAKFLAQAVASGKTQRVDLAHPIPIYILYLTAWVDADGVLESRPDVYERDPELLHALNTRLSEN